MGVVHSCEPASAAGGRKGGGGREKTEGRLGLRQEVAELVVVKLEVVV